MKEIVAVGRRQLHIKKKMHQFFLGDLILLPSVFFAIERAHTNFLVILFQSSHIFTSFREFALLHALSDIPMNKGPLGVHEIKLMVKSSPSLSNRSGIREHADCTRHFGLDLTISLISCTPRGPLFIGMSERACQ